MSNGSKKLALWWNVYKVKGSRSRKAECRIITVQTITNDIVAESSEESISARKVEGYLKYLTHQFDVSSTAYCVSINTNCSYCRGYNLETQLRGNHLPSFLRQKLKLAPRNCLTFFGLMTSISKCNSIRTLRRLVYGRHLIPMNTRRSHGI